MNNLTRKILFGLGLLAVLGSCAKSPLRPSDPQDIVTLIQQAQKHYVRTSYGELAHQCFTEADYQAFVSKQTAQNVAQRLCTTRKFMEAILALEKLPEVERSRFVETCRRPLRPTWRQLGRISRKGQNEAGQRAERDIADAVADLAVQMWTLSPEELQHRYANN